MRHANHGIRLILTVLASLTLTAFAPVARAQVPDFDTVAWTSLSCDAGDPAGDESPSAVDLVGDAAHPAAFIAHDASYLYFRYRVNGDPAGSGGFQSYAWNALMQVQSGNPFQYQYEISLDGKNDTVQIWANTNAYDIDFSPLFNDPSDVQLFSTSAAPLARHLAANDGSAFGGDGDYFVDFAVPVAALVDKGVIGSAADLDAALFFPATATNANNYNKGHLSCPFSPTAALAIDKTVTPNVVPANAMTPIAYKIAVTNGGPGHARGIVIDDPTLPGYFSNPSVSVASDDASVTWTVVHTNPLEVRVNDLPVGSTVTVTLAANANPSCGSNAYTNVATAFATNAASVSGSALLSINFVAGGCAPCTTDADCDDSNACTTDTCVAGGCSSAVIPGCTACAVDANCADDGNACTIEQCVAGVCTAPADPTCATACTVDADCHDGDPCTIDSCNAGTCVAMTDANCNVGACSTDADCDDGDACTLDTCDGGACTATPIEGCGSNPPPGNRPKENCEDRIDNDGDGLIDCADPDCAGNAACKGVEICGDCIDNDGDGLTDYDDPDCCADPKMLEMRRLMLRPAPKNASSKRLNLKVRNTGFDRADLDPRLAGATLQISDPNGMILCQPIPAVAWTHKGKRAFRFKDKTGLVAGGIKKARFLMKNTGKVPFNALGKSVLLGHTDGHDVKVTIGVGGQCSSSMTQLRAKGDRMLMLP